MYQLLVIECYSFRIKMALKFSTSPLSFRLNDTLNAKLMAGGKDDIYETIDDYVVKFSREAISSYKIKKPKTVSQLAFNAEFSSWVAKRPASELVAARNFALGNVKAGAASSSSSGARSGGGRMHGRAASYNDSGKQKADTSGLDRTGRKSDVDDTGYTRSEASETERVGEELLNTPLGARFSGFDLSGIQYHRSVKERHVPVSRGDYKGVLREIVFGRPGGYLITGPTGCGKSTVALLYLFLKPNTTVLVVEPTQANAANIYHEFKHILPVLAKRIKAPAVPAVSFVAPSTAKPPHAPLMVTTTDKYLEYFEYFGRVFPVDYVVIDEFHLPILSMVKMVELVRTFQLANKYVLVSATAVGVRVEPKLPSAVTCVTGRLEVGKLPKVLANSDLDPRRWARRGDGSFAVVAPSVSVAKSLHKKYRQWGCRSYLVTRETYVTDYVEAVSDYGRGVVYVMEPGVEAGVTLSMAVLVSMGATTAIRYDGKVVVEDTQPLDPISAIQRGSRGGRVVPTLYIQPPAPDLPPPTSSALYYRAQALVWLRSMGADLEKISHEGIFDVFPRVRTISVSLARACMQTGGDPFVAAYKHNDQGVVYEECGGRGDGFMQLAKSELFLYHWPGGFFVAPIADFSMPTSQPASFVLRDHQLRAAQAMVDGVPGLAEKYTLDRLVDLVIQKLDIYIGDLFDVLKSVFSGSKPTQFFLGDKPPEIEDFLRDSPEVTKMFTYLTTEPGNVRYFREVGGGDRPYACHSFKSGDKVLNFSFDKKFMHDGKVDVRLLSNEVFQLLNRILAVEILMNGAPEKCVDLSVYVDRVPTDHSWFDSNVRRSLR